MTLYKRKYDRLPGWNIPVNVHEYLAFPVERNIESCLTHLLGSGFDGRG